MIYAVQVFLPLWFGKSNQEQDEAATQTTNKNVTKTIS